jgi:HK97 family phage major capsid protein
MSHHKLSIPYLAEVSRATGSRFGGIQGYWLGEAQEIESSKPKFGLLDMPLSKLMALTPPIPEELLRDAKTLSAFLLKAYPAEMRVMVEDGIVNGDGLGKMLGILSCPALIVVDAESQAAGSITGTNVKKMSARLNPASRRHATTVWLVNPEIQDQIIELLDNGVSSISSMVRYTDSGEMLLLGKLVIPCEQCSAPGSVGDIILVDLQDYIIGSKGGIDMVSSGHVEFLSDQEIIKFRWRICGAPYSKSAVAPFKGTLTTSKYVTLAIRAGE